MEYAHPQQTVVSGMLLLLSPLYLKKKKKKCLCDFLHQASNHFLFTSWTDLLTEDPPLMASVTSLQALALPVPVTPLLTEENKMFFSNLHFTQNYLDLCLGKSFSFTPFLSSLAPCPQANRMYLSIV